jgi:hypothetical protein
VGAATMQNSLKWVLMLALLIMGISAYASAVTANISFLNETNRTIVQTKEPYLEPYSPFLIAHYEFIAPHKTIAPQQSSDANLAYEWNFDWYGASQFAYNYEGRSKNSGCFVTELRFSGYFLNFRNSNTVIASYIKDPAYPNDYLICVVEPNPSSTDSFIVRLQPSTQDEKSEDSQRFSMVGDVNLLAYTLTYGIDLPIPLNPILTLYPNQPQPELTRSHFSLPTTPPTYTDTLQVINHSSLTLVAGPQISDRSSKFSSHYVIDQPQEILPLETKAIHMSTSAYLNRFLARFNYHIKGYAEESGCYISTLLNWDNIASFHFDSQHPSPQPNLYCVMTNKHTIEIYDHLVYDLFQKCAAAKAADQIENCISHNSSNDFLDDLSWNSCGIGLHFNIDPIHKIAIRHVDCAELY